MGLAQLGYRQPYAHKTRFSSVQTPGTYYFWGGDNSYDLQIDTVQMFNSDVIDHLWRLSDDSDSDEFALGTILIPAGAGYGGLAPVDALALWQPAANHYLTLPQGAVLKYTVAEAVAAGKYVLAYSQGGYS